MLFAASTGATGVAGAAYRATGIAALALLLLLGACDQGGGSAPVTPVLQVSDQFLAGGQVKVGKAVVRQAGWVTVWHRQEGKLALLGKKPVEPGTHAQVRIDVEEGFADALLAHGVGRLQVVLHHDRGRQGTLEYARGEGPDQPVKVAGKAVSGALYAFYAPGAPDAYIAAQDQEIENRTIVIEEVKASEPATILVHRSRGKVPLVPGSVAKVAVEEGLSEGVEIKLNTHAQVRCGEKLWPMLHVRSTSDDQPYNIDQPIVTTSFVRTCG